MDSLIPFTTSGSLVDSVDKKMFVLLRDGRKLFGVLRSYDQFANLVLEDTVERLYHGSSYGDIQRGVFLIRGENVVLMGEVDLDKEDILPLQPVELAQIIPVHREEVERRKVREAAKAKILFEQSGKPFHDYLLAPNGTRPMPYVPPFAEEALQALQHINQRSTSDESDFRDAGSLNAFPHGDSDLNPTGAGDTGELDESGKKKKNRAGHGVGSGMTTTYTKNNKPIQWTPPPTFPYNLIPGRDLNAHVVPQRSVASPLSVSWPPFREDGPTRPPGPKPKKKPESEMNDDDPPRTPMDDASMDIDNDSHSPPDDGPSKQKPKPKPKAKTEKPLLSTPSKKAGQKTEKSKNLEHEKEEREQEKADRAPSKATTTLGKTGKLDKTKKSDKSAGASSSSMAGSSKKKSKSVAFTANQGVRVDGARNAVVEESEEEEEPEEEAIDTRLYCICKQMYDDDRLMIACDNCDDWCHPGCVHLPEDDLDLVDLFYCPNCLATYPNLSTTYKTACVQCRRPARLPLSKFCSDECGIACVMKRVDDWSASLTSSGEPRTVGSKATAALSAQLEASTAVRFAKRREGLVSIESVSGAVSLPSDGKRLEGLRALEKLRASLEELKIARVQKVKAIAAIDARLVLLDLTMQRNESEGGTRCGYDLRLGMDEGVWEDFVESEGGRRAFEGHGIGLDPRREAMDAIELQAAQVDEELEMRELETCICDGPKRKCERHAGWQKLKKADFDLEKDITERSLQKLKIKHKELCRRIEDIEALRTPPDSAVGHGPNHAQQIDIILNDESQHDPTGSASVDHAVPMDDVVPMKTEDLDVDVLG
ncbi:SM-like, degradation of cytoplasmic mRNAs and positively regulates transcription initiation [Tulasnella sp. 331]|nr:SM-like, degradation of cytoplasmic mRNAs and positively regulates transcription initiation [Tulasnella sp. 331]